MSLELLFRCHICEPKRKKVEQQDEVWDDLNCVRRVGHVEELHRAGVRVQDVKNLGVGVLHCEDLHLCLLMVDVLD